VNPHWSTHIDAKRRSTALAVLQTLSQLQDKKSVSFIVIGAISLLMKDYLQYTVYWDVDVLFKDKEALETFISTPKPRHIRIVDYDDSLNVNKNIASLHTAWSSDRIWFNVDYILRDEIYTFYTHSVERLQPHVESVACDNIRFDISLLIAHPWDIVIEKVVSPRTQRDIEHTIDTSVDIRHIFAICEKEKENHRFWQYLLENAHHLCDESVFREKLLHILTSAAKLGYPHIAVPDDVMTQLMNR
jgi:hypothetical protein